MIVLMVAFSYFALSNVMLTGANGVYNHLNKLYMALLMGDIMILIDGIIMLNAIEIIISLIVAIILILMIRQQTFISDREFLKGMIEHHDMAILMAGEISKKTNSKKISDLAKNIISSQQGEINEMKSWL